MSEDVIGRFQALKQWSKNGLRAPHKPLMLLIALGRYQNGITEFSYEEIEPELTDLLIKYGPQRSTYKPEEPFWRLGRTEKLFSLTSESKCRLHKDGGTNRSDLIKNDVTARLDAEVEKYLRENPNAIPDIAVELIETHFQPSFIEDLMEEVGISFSAGASEKGRARDPEFRHRVLKAYRDRCAVCQFHMTFNHRTIGLEAAHIKWHNAGGPDTENNGFALCSMHHKLFDYGAFLVEPETFLIRISDAVSCFNSAENFVENYHNKKILLPVDDGFRPKKEFLNWHKKEKFKGRPRA